MERTFARDLLASIHKRYPEVVAGLPDELLLRRIEHGIEKASRYEIRSRFGVACFAQLMFLIAPDFDEDAVFRKRLQDRRFSPDRRIEILLQETKDADWEEAKRRCHPNAWPAELQAPQASRGAGPVVVEEQYRRGLGRDGRWSKL